MGCSASSSKNDKGFTEQLQDYTDTLPPADHLTYDGSFNQLQLNVGQKTQLLNDLDIGWGITHNRFSLLQQKNDVYLSLVTKSVKDGEKREGYPIYAMIGLDKSGSMNGQLSQKSAVNRLTLAKQATLLFIKNLRPDDKVGLFVFDNKATTILSLQKKSEIDIDILTTQLDDIEANGGTTIKNVFTSSLESFQQSTDIEVKYVEKRIILLSDVEDNQFQSQKQLIEDLATQHNINTTIIGISKDFNSSSCENLTEVKGFNYFCAVEDSDLIKYVVDQFDYTFFPFAHNMQIKLSSPDIKSVEIFGTPDSLRLNQNPVYTEKPNEEREILITQSPTLFPSPLNLLSDLTISQEGGLILIKLKDFTPNKNLQGTISLTYQNLAAQSFSQTYQFFIHSENQEQIFTKDYLQKGVEAQQIVQVIKDTLLSYHTEGPKTHHLEAITHLNQQNPSVYSQEILKISQILQSQLR